MFWDVFGVFLLNVFLWCCMVVVGGFMVVFGGFLWFYDGF